MDEHIRIFSGTTITVEEGNQVDANLNDLTWWTEKHNGYATREMADMLMMEYGLDDRGKEVQAKFWGWERNAGRDEASAISTLLREDLSCQSRSAEVYFFAGCIS